MVFAHAFAPTPRQVPGEVVGAEVSEACSMMSRKLRL
jgi:hypothetical protein